MTGMPKNVEELLDRLAENSQSELDLVRTLADAIRRVDERMLREVRNVTLEHEIRREAIFSELQNLAGRMCSLPARSATRPTIDQQGRTHAHVAIDAGNGVSGGDWRQAAQKIDDELEFTFNGRAASH